MNEHGTLGISGINALFEIFVVATLLILFWMLEVVWRNERKKILLVFVCPPLLLFYIYKYWDEMRAKLFFAAVLGLVILMLSVVSNYNYFSRLAALLQIIFLWPYYLLLYVGVSLV